MSITDRYLLEVLAADKDTMYIGPDLSAESRLYERIFWTNNNEKHCEIKQTYIKQ